MRNGKREARCAEKNERGVALLIVLLVTALLTALIFEFAYGTRISLRAAVNFRDSQRAYFLARAGVNFAGALLSDNLKNGKPQDNLEQRDWQLVPVMTGSDTELRVRWEDEGGKINIGGAAKGSLAYERLRGLFELRGVSQDKLDLISAWMIEEKKNLLLLTELHRFLSDEELHKVKDALTVAPVYKINVNTASVDVLQSIGLSQGMAGMIADRRVRESFKTDKEFSDFLGPELAARAGGAWSLTSDVFKVESFATVGGYTKQVEAVIKRTDSGYTTSYWRAL